ncbi:MAG: PAS domain S-box protein [Desulfobacterales bacterium]|nr:PAS domain S-box protein [Desulfobacterales bacterium]
MKLQTKISLAILPLVAAVIIALGSWSIFIATRGIEEAMYRTVVKELSDYIEAKIVKNHELLVSHDLAKIPSYVQRYQQEAIQAADNLTHFKTGNLTIVDAAQQKILYGRARLAKHPDEWGALLEKVRRLDGADVKGRWVSSSGPQIYIGRYFAPWQWTLIYAVSSQELEAPVARIRNATLVAAGICGLACFAMLFWILHRSVVRPVVRLKEAAAAIAAMQPVTQIPVRSEDELGALARDMEQMARAIQGYRNEKEQWQKELEAQIEARTNDLRQVNNALQKEIRDRQKVNADLRANELALNVALELKQDSEERFRAIFESTKDSIMVWGANLQCLYANEAAIRTVGGTRDQVVGRGMHEGLSHRPDMMQSWMDRVRRVFASEAPLAVEDVTLVGTRTVYSESVLSPIRDLHGRVFAVGAVYRDVTARKEMERQIAETLALNEIIVSASTVGIAAYDADGSCILANEAMARMLGASQEKLLSQNFNLIASWQNTGMLEQACKVIADGDERQQEFFTTSSFDKQVWLNCTLSRFHRSGRPHLLVVADDIAQRKRMQAELEARNRALEESNKELDDFAYIASHDLREPLRGIANYAGFLMEDYADRLDADGRDKLETLVRLCRREDSLIDALLEYSRVGRTELVLEAVDLNMVLGQVLDRIGHLIADAAIEVRIPEALPTVRCDRVRISEVYFNLITNAVKYNDKEHKWVEIGYQMTDNRTDGSSGAAHSGGRSAGPVLYVRDNGVGIQERHYDRIFSIFQRLHARDKFGGGIGAGLTIVKKIVERHNGKIWVASEYGQGTTFFFTLAESGP